MSDGRPGASALTAREIIQRGRAHAEALRRSRQRIAEALEAPSAAVDGLSDRERSQMTGILRRLAEKVPHDLASKEFQQPIERAAHFLDARMRFWM